MSIAGKLVKVSRCGESFWVRDVREVASGVWVGTVDNDLAEENDFRAGDTIPFAPQEIRDVKEYAKPALSLVRRLS